MTASELQAFFHQQLSALSPGEPGQTIAIAVSGGSDSMALALLAQDWAEAAGLDLLALTVDHGLREQSGAEAKSVADWLRHRGIAAEILCWTGPHPKSGIQQAAREARYRLMAARCREIGISALLLGHQREDQVETMLMRLSKGSGLEGLAAMRAAANWQDLRLLRPLLGASRDQLRQYLLHQGQDWIEDPSNENPDFTRTHVGAVARALGQLPGSSLETIALSARRLDRASQALDQLTSERFDGFCQISPYGFISFSGETITECPAEIGLRLLARALSMVVGDGGRIKLKSLEQLYERLFISNASHAETLAGCHITKYRKNWMICRELGREGLPEMQLSAGASLLWDHRFLVSDMAANDSHAPLVIRRIGTDGWRGLDKLALTEEERKLPVLVRESLPAVWSGEKLLAVPLFSGDPAQSIIAKDRFKMVFRPLI